MLAPGKGIGASFSPAPCCPCRACCPCPGNSHCKPQTLASGLLMLRNLQGRVSARRPERLFASLERRPTASKGVSACTTRFQLLQSEVWGAAFSLGCCSTTVRRPGDTFLAHNNCRELAAAQLRGMPPACRGHLPCSVKDGGLNPPPCCRRHAPAAGPAGRAVGMTN